MAALVSAGSTIKLARRQRASCSVERDEASCDTDGENHATTVGSSRCCPPWSGDAVQSHSVIIRTIGGWIQPLRGIPGVGRICVAFRRCNPGPAIPGRKLDRWGYTPRNEAEKRGFASACVATIPRMESVVSELNAEGQRAYAIAADRVGDEQYHFAVERFARAVDMSSRLWAEWVELGRPLLLEAPNGVRYPHPLIKLYREWAADAAAASKAVLLDPSQVKHSRPGRPLGSTSAPDRQRPGLTIVDRAEPPRVKARKLVADPL